MCITKLGIKHTAEIQDLTVCGLCPIRSQPMTKTGNKARPEHLQNGKYPQMKQTTETKKNIRVKSPFHLLAVCKHVKATLRQNCWFCGKFILTEDLVFSVQHLRRSSAKQAAHCYILCSSSTMAGAWDKRKTNSSDRTHLLQQIQ